MQINVATRKIRRAVRLPEGDIPATCGGRRVEVRRFAALRSVIGGAHEGMTGWMDADLSALDIMVLPTLS
jgi:hypothetical protein